MKEFKTVQEIRVERGILRENKELYTLLGVILAELDRRVDLTKEPSVEDIYKVIKKLYDAAIECGNKGEEAYLEQFIKKQLSEAELEDAIKDLVAMGSQNIGAVMKGLNAAYAGQYDGKLASQIARKYV